MAAKKQNVTEIQTLSKLVETSEVYYGLNLVYLGAITILQSLIMRLNDNWSLFFGS